MKIEKLLFLAAMAAVLFAVALFAACGDDDDDDDTSDDTTPTTCEEAMDFLFGTDGCFTLTDNEGNVISANTLCTDADYEDLSNCYKACYDENDDCETMGACLTQNCGLSF